MRIYLQGYLFLMLFFGSCMIPNKQPISTQDPLNEIDEIINRMTLEEKVGQMTNVSLMAVAEGEFWKKRDTVVLDKRKLQKILVEHKVGSVQNLGTYPFSPEEWRKNIDIVQDYAIRETRLGIPIIYGIDAVHGANYSSGSTLFPHQIGLAATWNPEIAKIVGEITSYEMRASGIPWNYAPVLDISKQPLWGRIFETFGEDTYLAEVMGLAMLKGAQGADPSSFNKTLVCAKHFLGYGTPFNGKDRTLNVIPERMLRQYYLPPFKSAIENGLLTIMINSGSVNGIPSHSDKFLITDLLKNELGFKGFTISDWEDVVNLYKIHQVAKNEKEAVMLAVNAGLDMCMDPYDASFAVHLIELVNSGDVEISRVNDAVRRILWVKKKIGLFNKVNYSLDLYPKYGSHEFANQSLNAAEESITLLKNENGILPINSKDKILITGVAANSINYLNGAWSRTWSGIDTTYNDKDKNTILHSLRKVLGNNQLKYVQGTSYLKELNIKEAVEAASGVDKIVVVLGEKPATEKPSDINELNLPAAQIKLVNELAKTGKPLILILVEGRPRIIRQIVPLAKGILMAYLPGNEGGDAITNILLGNVNPSGKLPYTYPKYSGSIWSYDHTKADDRGPNFGYGAFDPQFEFGFGLSYTRFQYSNLKINKDTLLQNEKLNVSIELKNVGSLPGKEVIQMYVSDKVASIVPEVKRLKKFRKMELKPNEIKTIKFSLDFNDLAFVDRENKWKVEDGDFEIQIDTLATKFYYKNSNYSLH